MTRIVHRCRFVKWTPQAINTLAMSPLGCRPLLAALRANGDIELIDLHQNWQSWSIPVGGSLARSIEAMLWLNPKNSPSLPAQITASDATDYTLYPGCLDWEEERKLPTGRLITGGLDGMLVEWDVNRLTPARHATILGGGIWSMTTSDDHRHLAVGCEDGHVRIVKVSTMETVLTLPHHEAKCLSLAWSGDMVVGGMTDGHLLVWSVSVANKTAVKKHQMNANINDAEQAPLVWCVRFLPASLSSSRPVIVSGNSVGQVQFWNAALGTMIHTQKVHRGDIFTFTITPTGDGIYTGGADGVTMKMNSFNNGRQWKISDKRTDHSRDIRASLYTALPINGKEGKEVLISAGVDGDIVALDVEKGIIRRHSGLPTKSIIKLSPDERLMTVCLGDHFDVYHLATARAEDAAVKASKDASIKLPLTQPGRHVLQLNIPHGEHAINWDISSNGQYLAYTTRSSLRVFKFTISKSEGLPSDIAVEKCAIPDGPHGKTPQMVKFSPDSQSLVVDYLASDKEASSSVVLYTIDGTSLAETSDVDLPSCTTPMDLTCWKEGVLACHDASNAIHLFTISPKHQLKSFLHIKPPTKYIAAMDIVNEQLLMIAADGTIFTASTTLDAEISLKKNKKVSSSQTLIPMAHVSTSYAMPPSIGAIQSLTILGEDSLLLSTPRTGLTKVDLKAAVNQSEPLSRDRKRKSDKAITSNTSSQHISGFDSLMGVAALNEKELVVVECSVEIVEAVLPKAVKRKRFGRH